MAHSSKLIATCGANRVSEAGWEKAVIKRGCEKLSRRQTLGVNKNEGWEVVKVAEHCLSVIRDGIMNPGHCVSLHSDSAAS